MLVVWGLGLRFRVSARAGDTRVLAGRKPLGHRTSGMLRLRPRPTPMLLAFLPTAVPDVMAAVFRVQGVGFKARGWKQSTAPPLLIELLVAVWGSG